ncbi:MAG: hypothetical protein ACI4W6_06855 [Acutalibacteraceae bacterium]
MALKDIDKKAEEKGSGLVTLWQFVKFIVVSLLACIVQFALLNILAKIPAIHNLYQTPFNWFVFNYDISKGGLGYFIAFNTANIAAQIVAFFVNKEKTFNSDANVAVTLPIYIIFTVALITFSAWLSPTIYGALTSKLGETLSLNIATAICSALQFFLYFPVDKLLMKSKKKDKSQAEETE